MPIIYKKISPFLLACIAFPAANANELDVELYGSFRLAVESVDADQADDYSGFRDAYSRIGLKASHAISDGWSVMGQVELPVDLANGEINDQFNTNDNVRIAKIQLNSPYGNVWYGKGWMAYYNYIAYPVDFFSSYYSGFATTTSFQENETLYYVSPVFSGLQLALATSDDSGSGNDERHQYVMSYSRNGFSIALGRDDKNGTTEPVDGISASYTGGPWYIAAKFEKDDNFNDVSNLLLQYQIDEKNTVRGMLANYDGYGGDILHLGWDHQYQKDMKFFAEFYQEETHAVIESSNNPSNWINTPPGQPQGGSVLTVGMRYDFSFK